MINTTGSLVGAEKSGLLDCVTYASGISGEGLSNIEITPNADNLLTGSSGSCWALGAMYSGVAGSTNPMAAAQHLQRRISTSYLDMSTLDMLITPPTNKVSLIMCGVVNFKLMSLAVSTSWSPPESECPTGHSVSNRFIWNSPLRASAGARRYGRYRPHSAVPVPVSESDTKCFSPYAHFHCHQ